MSPERRRGKVVDLPAKPAPGWRSRIVDHGVEKADQLLANPGNWRIHPQVQQKAVAGLLDEVGWVQDVVVNRTTGHVVDGHLRVAMAISRGESVPVVYVELTPDEEELVLATMDPLTGMGVTDEAKLAELLKGVEADGALGELLAELGEGIAVAEARVAAATPDGNKRDLGDREHLVKAALYVDEIDVVERALAKTGEAQRGAAFLAICRSYLGEGG